MRINRALEKLQELLKRRGVTTTAAGLSAALLGSAVHAAPVGLAAAISMPSALGGTVLPGSAVMAVSKAVVMTTLQKAIVAAVITLAGGAGLFQARRIAALQSQVKILQQRQAPWSNELEQVRHNRDQDSNRLAAVQHENDQVRRDNAELARLRGQVGQLRKATDVDGDIDEPKFWAAKARVLKQRLENAPERTIPEMALLKETDWLEAAKEANLKTEAGTRKAFNDLRTRAKRAFGELLQKAFQQYAEGHNDELPAVLTELEPFLGAQNVRDILARYSYKKEGLWSELPAQEELVHVTAPRVDFYDSQVQVLKTGMVIDNPALPEDENVLHVLDAFFAGNYANEPRSLSELEPYFKTPEERAALEKLFKPEASTQGK